METKICSKCCLERPIENYYPNRGKCKVCFLNECKEKYNKNRETVLNKKKEKYDPIKEKEKNQINYRRHREKRLKQQKEYVEKNKEKVAQYKKQWAQEKKEHLREYRKKYNLENKDYINERNHKRLKNDPLYAFTVAIRKNILKAFRKRGFDKRSSTQIILGCTFEEFKIYMESKFEDWMNWDNRGLYNGTPNYGWDVDHIIPVTTGNTIEEIIKLNHYTNLQPLCSYINRDVKKDDTGFVIRGCK